MVGHGEEGRLLLCDGNERASPRILGLLLCFDKHRQHRTKRPAGSSQGYVDSDTSDIW